MNTYFKFQIKQTVNVLLYKIQNGDGKKWNVEKAEDGTLTLREMRESDNETKISVHDGVMEITTVHDHHYTIHDRQGDGASVEFHGPVNALLTQYLMPRMTYVPGTLFGTNSCMEGYLPIAEFLKLRAGLHGNKQNPQDKFGWRVNRAFNNELAPWLAPCREIERQERIGSKKSRKKAAGKFSRR